MVCVEDDVFETLYPEIDEAGTLTAVVEELLSGHPEVSCIGWSTAATGWTTVQGRRGRTAVSTALNIRRFHFSLWHEGCLFGTFSSKRLDRLEVALVTWLDSTVPPIELLGSQLLTIDGEAASAHAKGPEEYVRREWDRLVSRSETCERVALVAALNEPQLRRLMPYTSLDRLRFSTTTGYPFDSCVPSLTMPLKSGRPYVVHLFDNSVEHFDTAEAAAARLNGMLTSAPLVRHGAVETES